MIFYLFPKYRKKMIQLDDYINYKMDFCKISLNNKYVMPTHHFILNSDLYFVKPTFEVNI